MKASEIVLHSCKALALEKSIRGYGLVGVSSASSDTASQES